MSKAGNPEGGWQNPADKPTRDVLNLRDSLSLTEFHHSERRLIAPRYPLEKGFVFQEEIRSS